MDTLLIIKIVLASVFGLIGLTILLVASHQRAKSQDDQATAHRFAGLALVGLGIAVPFIVMFFEEGIIQAIEALGANDPIAMLIALAITVGKTVLAWAIGVALIWLVITLTNLFRKALRSRREDKLTRE